MDANSFWQWFKENEIDYRLIGAEQDNELSGELVKQLDEQLSKYCTGIHGIIRGTEETKTLIITAYGEKEMFNQIEDLVKQAPQINTWQFIALLPPVKENFTIQVDGFKLNTEEIKFLPKSAYENPALCGLGIYVPKYKGLEPEKQKKVELLVNHILMEVGGEKQLGLVVDFMEVHDMLEMPEDVEPIDIINLNHFLVWFHSQREAEKVKN